MEKLKIGALNLLKSKIMKKFNLLICCCILWSVNVLSQGKCSKFYPIKENASFTLGVFDASNVELGKMTYDVIEVIGDSAVYTVKMSLSGFPERVSQFEISCTDAGVSMSFSAMSGGMSGGANNAKITGNNIYLPNELSVGQTLPDAEMSMSSSSSPTRINMSRKMYNRKIDRIETISAAGESFICFVLTYDTIMTMSGGMNIRTKTEQFLAENVGTVKTMEYDGDGNLTGTTKLTSYRLN